MCDARVFATCAFTADETSYSSFLCEKTSTKRGPLTGLVMQKHFSCPLENVAHWSQRAGRFSSSSHWPPEQRTKKTRNTLLVSSSPSEMMMRITGTKCDEHSILGRWNPLHRSGHVWKRRFRCVIHLPLFRWKRGQRRGEKKRHTFWSSVDFTLVTVLFFSTHYWSCSLSCVKGWKVLFHWLKRADEEACIKGLREQTQRESNTTASIQTEGEGERRQECGKLPHLACFRSLLIGATWCRKSFDRETKCVQVPLTLADRIIFFLPASPVSCRMLLLSGNQMTTITVRKWEERVAGEKETAIKAVRRLFLFFSLHQETAGNSVKVPVKLLKSL